jgi:rare lipoprotein A
MNKRYIVLIISTLLSFTFLEAQTQKGKASFYAKKFSGRKTASGERLHTDSMTCAHLKYPFGTMLKVTNVLNGKQVVVRVNDRGPYRKGRIIDLSWGAAKAIGMIAQGVVPVTVEKVSDATIPFKPEDPSLPQFDFELADIDPAGIVPVWQQEIDIDPHEVQQSMHSTAKKLMQERKANNGAEHKANTNAEHAEAAKATAPTPPKTKEQEQKNVLDEINEKPNASKVYQKREGKRP